MSAAVGSERGGPERILAERRVEAERVFCVEGEGILKQYRDRGENQSAAKERDVSISTRRGATHSRV